MAEPGELFLIDGNSLAYRAFFALPESMATSKGEPTNAIFGFASMLAKVLTAHAPKAVVVVWDAGMSGREKTYPEYKATRPPRPDLLAEQWPHLQPLVEAFGFGNIKVEGYEADDVIASLAERAKQAGIRVMVVTGDRDAYQMVDDDMVKVMTTSRGITDTRIYDREAVIERYGIPPEMVPDFIGLKGDTSDNIPGVPGIGEKTAAELLNRFGSLEEVLANVDEISGPKRRESLIAHADDARTSKLLATLNREIDCGLDPMEEMERKPDMSRLREVLGRFEVREPLRRLEEALGGELGSRTEDAKQPGRSRECSPNELGELLPEGEVALVVEPGSEGRITFGVHAGGDEALFGTATPGELLSALSERPVIAHDFKSIVRETDRQEEEGATGRGGSDAKRGGPDAVDRSGASPALSHDTMVAAYLLEPTRRRYPLDELARQEGIPMVMDRDGDLPGKVMAIRRLAERQREAIDRHGLDSLLNDVELPLVEVLCAMERVGVKLDTYRLGEISAKVADQVEQLEHEIWELAGEQFMIGSPQQLADVLFEKLGLSRKRRGKTGFSTDARVLKTIRDEHPIVQKVERWRELAKLKNTYLDALPDLVDERAGRLHTTFNQVATATGRLSSANPNLQNVPVRTPMGREIRGCFVAEDGCRVISADYSQVELRVLAHIAGEDVLKDIFSRDLDVHSATAAQLFDVPLEKVGYAERGKAKAVNFGIIYGQTPFGLSQQLDISVEEAGAYIEEYLGRFPAVQTFIRETVARAETEGSVRTILGRTRPIPELKARRPQTRQLGERLAVNTVIQGSAADIIKLAMVGCYRALRKGEMSTRIVLQIHDELLFEGPEAEVEKASELMREQMEGAYALDPPLRVDVGVGESWMEAKA